MDHSSNNKTFKINKKKKIIIVEVEAASSEQKFCSFLKGWFE